MALRDWSEKIRVSVFGDALAGYRMAAVALGFIAITAVAASLVLYGTSVHIENAMSLTAQKTWELNEENKELQVKLNQTQSFENVSSVAQKAPHLRLPQRIIEVRDTGSIRLPRVKKTPMVKAYPYVFGY